MITKHFARVPSLTTAATAKAFSLPVLCVLLSLVYNPSARGITSSWTGTGTGTWTDATWNNGVPGGVGTTTNQDVASFDLQGGSTTITVDTGRNIRGITFGASATSTTLDANAMTIGSAGADAGPALTLSSAATITFGNYVSVGETINAPLILEGGLTVNTISVEPAGILTIGGSITPGVSSAVSLTLTGSFTGNNTVSGTISNGTAGGSLALTKSANSKWILSGTNTYTGATIINQGTLQAGSTQAFGTNSAVNLTPASSGVTNNILNLNGFSNTVGSLTSATNGGTFAGNVTLGTASINTNATLTIAGNNSTAVTYAGTITNAAAGTGVLSLTKNGSGVQILTGTNTYSGATTINAGTLAVNGSGTASATTINSGGILSGTGTVAAMTLNSNGTITPGTAGTSTGTLTGTSLTFNGGGILSYTLGTGSNATGLLSLSGALTQGTAGAYDISLSGGTAGNTYELVGFGSTTFAASAFTDIGSTPGTFSIANSELLFTVAAVPEPGTLWSGLLCAGGACYVVARRRRAAQG